MSVIDAAPASSPTVCRNRGNTTGCFNPRDVLIHASFPSSPGALKLTSWETRDWGIRMADNYPMGCISLGHRVSCWEASPRVGHNASAMGTLLRAQGPAQIPPKVVTAFWEGGQGSEHLYTSSLIHPDTGKWLLAERGITIPYSYHSGRGIIQH